MISNRQRAVSIALLVGSLVGQPSVLGAQAGDAPAVTLSEARRRAASLDPAAVAALEQIGTARWERRAALSNLLTPAITAGASYTHFSEPFFNFGTGTISPNATSATIQASYSLFGIRKLSELRRARASLESAQASETAVRFRSSLETDAAYFAVLADRELARVAADRLARAREQFGIARARVLAGGAIAADSLQLLLEVNRARLAVLRADSALEVSRLRLGRRIGLEGPAEAAVIDTTGPPPLPLTRDEAVAELRARGPELEAARAEERTAEAALSSERSGYFPEITIGATTGAYDAEFFPSATRRSQIGLTVSLPIWDGGQRELAIARASAGRAIARAERADRERSAAELVAATHTGYETARAGIELAVVAVAAAGENYRVQRARYGEGETTILDLMEAQVALSEAEAELVQARYAARLALAQLEALLGRRLFPPQDSPAASW